MHHEGAWPRAGGGPFRLLDWVGSHKKRSSHFRSPGQIKAVAQTGIKKPPVSTLKEKIALSLGFFRSQLLATLEGEPGTKDALVTFSSRSISLQSPCPGGPGDLLNDHGFCYLLPQGYLMHLALVGSC